MVHARQHDDAPASRDISKDADELDSAVSETVDESSTDNADDEPIGKHSKPSSSFPTATDDEPVYADDNHGYTERDTNHTEDR